MSNKNKGVIESFQDAWKQIKEAKSNSKRDKEAYFGTNTREGR